MDLALMGVEGLAAALFGLAVLVRWAARGRAARRLVPALYVFVPAGAAGLILLQYHGNWDAARLVRTPWFTLTLTWLVAFAVASGFLAWHGLRRGGPGLAGPAAAWSRRRLWLGLGGSVLALLFTAWNLDLAARADLAVARQEAGAVLLEMTPPPVAGADNAAPLYAAAGKLYGPPLPEALKDAVRRGRDATEAPDWKGPAMAELAARSEAALALLRTAAARPGCQFDYQRTVLDAVTDGGPETRRLGHGVMLLAIDARVKAAGGDLRRAFDDIAAILGIFRHLAGYPGLWWGGEVIAWRALEDVLWLAPAAEGPLPPFDVPELFPLVRRTREEHALLGMILPAAASQPSLVLKDERHRTGPAEAFLIEQVVAPATRVFVIPDELPAMRKLFDDYRRSPRTAGEETPQDWAATRDAVATDPTSVFSLVYIKPKQRKLLSDGERLAALRQLGRTGYAVAAYRRHHGRYPERLEQLVPEFLPAMPTDPRDGQPLRLRATRDGLVVYGPTDRAAVEGETERPVDSYWLPPIFRLPAAP